jgi:hypothetical protein
MELAAAATAVARGGARFSCRTREGATGLPRAVWLSALFRDQEVEDARRKHCSCALLRAEKLDCVRHEFLGMVRSAFFLIMIEPSRRAFVRRSRLIRIQWQAGLR